MRESFQVLDRDDDGQVTQEDVQQMLTDLGWCKRRFAASNLRMTNPYEKAKTAHRTP